METGVLMQIKYDNPEHMLFARMMLSVNAVNLAMTQLNESDFDKINDKAIFSSMAQLYKQNHVVEPLNVVTVLAAHFPKFLDHSLVISLTGLYGNGDHSEVQQFINQIKTTSQYRKIFDVAKRVAQKAADKHDKPEEIQRFILTETEQVFNTASSLTTKTLKEDGDFLDSQMNYLEFISKQISDFQQGKHTFRGVPTGYSKLDDILSGICKGHFIIIGARPGVGKTTFALNLMYMLMKRMRQKIGFFSFEMTADEVAHKLICLHANIDSESALRGKISYEQYQAIIASKKYCENLPLFIEDQAPLTIDQVIARTKRLVATENIDMLFVDYLGEIKGTGDTGTKQEEIQQVSRGLRQLAKSLRIPVICICQLNRKSEDEQRPPRKSDLRESGQIEADAHSILMLHQEPKQLVAKVSDHYNNQVSEDDFYSKKDAQFDKDNFHKSTTKVYIVKNRFGPQGVVHFGFEGNTGKFFELDYRAGLDEPE